MSQNKSKVRKPAKKGLVGWIFESRKQAVSWKI